MKSNIRRGSSGEKRKQCEWKRGCFARWMHDADFIEAIQAKKEACGRKSECKTDRHLVSVLVVHKSRVLVGFGMPGKWRAGVAQAVLEGSNSLAMADVNIKERKVLRVTDLKTANLEELLPRGSPREASELATSLLDDAATIICVGNAVDGSPSSFSSPAPPSSLVHGKAEPTRLPSNMQFNRSVQPSTQAGSCSVAEAKSSFRHGAVGAHGGGGAAAPNGTMSPTTPGAGAGPGPGAAKAESSGFGGNPASIPSKPEREPQFAASIPAPKLALPPASAESSPPPPPSSAPAPARPSKPPPTPPQFAAAPEARAPALAAVPEDWMPQVGSGVETADGMLGRVERVTTIGANGHGTNGKCNGSWSVHVRIPGLPGGERWLGKGEVRPRTPLRDLQARAGVFQVQAAASASGCPGHTPTAAFV